MQYKDKQQFDDILEMVREANTPDSESISESDEAKGGAAGGKVRSNELMGGEADHSMRQEGHATRPDGAA